MGVKYVKDFTFPSDFGFTGSAGRVAVRPHMRQRFAKGGRVKPSPGQVVGATLAAGAGAAAYKKLKDREREEEKPRRTSRGTQLKDQERRLGLKHGGKLKKAMGGPVKAQKGGDMRKIAREEVIRHVNKPAPTGHKGQRKC